MSLVSLYNLFNQRNEYVNPTYILTFKIVNMIKQKDFAKQNLQSQSQSFKVK